MDACTWQSRLTLVDAAVVVAQPGASIGARCTLKSPGMDCILCLRRSCALWIPAHQPAAEHHFFLFSLMHSRRRFACDADLGSELIIKYLVNRNLELILPDKRGVENQIC